MVVECEKKIWLGDECVMKDVVVDTVVDVWRGARVLSPVCCWPNQDCAAEAVPRFSPKNTSFTRVDPQLKIADRL